MRWYHWLTIFGVTFIPLVTALWHAFYFLIALRKDVDSLLTNHLPHMQMELEGLRSDLRVYFGSTRGAEIGRNKTSYPE